MPKWGLWKKNIFLWKFYMGLPCNCVYLIVMCCAVSIPCIVLEQRFSRTPWQYTTISRWSLDPTWRTPVLQAFGEASNFTQLPHKSWWLPLFFLSWCPAYFGTRCSFNTWHIIIHKWALIPFPSLPPWTQHPVPYSWQLIRTPLKQAAFSISLCTVWSC